MDSEPGTREDLLRFLHAAGLGRRQAESWVDNPAALASGLVPGVAIEDPDTATRVRHAAQRLAARVTPRAPDGIQVVGLRVLQTYRLELTFDDGARRTLDVEPFLWGDGFGPVRSDAHVFQRASAQGEVVRWPTGAALPAGLLYRVSRDVEGA